MQRRTLLAGMAVAVAGCSSSATSGPDAAAAADQLRTAINDERASAAVAELAPSDTLAEAAREHSRDMHQREFYAHENPDGEQPWNRVPCQASENIHRGKVAAELRGFESEDVFNTTTAAGIAGYVRTGWVNSDGHYHNMTRSEWTEIGVGVYVGADEFYATAMFC
jgi:uncharacterized protein YkwD